MVPTIVVMGGLLQVLAGRLAGRAAPCQVPGPGMPFSAAAVLLDGGGAAGEWRA
jgi:hypothetical protein